MDFPGVVRFPVPLDKGNDCSGDEIESSSSSDLKVANREFKKLLRRRRIQRRSKNEFIFYLRISGYS